MVGKTLEQSMMEVLEEEELEAIRAHQEEFEQVRNAELAEVQRLEAEARRRFEEKQRRLEQERARVEREADLKEKVSARAFAKEYLTELHTGVFDVLLGEGFFYDPLTKEVEESFMPWLMAQATTDGAGGMGSIGASAVSRQAADFLLQSALGKAQAAFTAASEARAAARRNPLEVAAEEAEAAAIEAERVRLEEEAKAAAAAEAGEEGDGDAGDEESKYNVAPKDEKRMEWRALGQGGG